MAFQHSSLTKEQFLGVNKPELLRLIAEVNDNLRSRHGQGFKQLNAHDIWIVFYIEAGLKNGKVDINHRHSEGERGLLPLPSNIRTWNGSSAPAWNHPMRLVTNLYHFFLYLGQIKNKVVATTSRFKLYPQLFTWSGISGNPEHEAKLLAGVVHGYFYSPNYSNRRVPFDHILEGFARNDRLTTIMDPTRYVHARSSVLVGRERNIATALSLSSLEEPARQTEAFAPAYVSEHPVAETMHRSVSTSEAVAENLFYVATDHLNLRTRPDDTPATIIWSLDIGQKVVVTGNSTTGGWKTVVAEIGGQSFEGHVFGKYLRAPQNPDIENLLRHTYREWFRFERGTGREDRQPYAGYVGEMWRELDIPGRDGTSPYAWSAAFISWVIKKANYRNFMFSGLHAEYIHQAIRRREMSIDGPFWGFRLDEHKPRLGDIVCQWRENEDDQGRPFEVDYDYAEDHDYFFSHTDIVVEVRERSIRAIGGNTGQRRFGHKGSVSMKTYRLHRDGFLRDENRLFAVMRNNLAN